MNKTWEHFKLVIKHKKYVFKHCRKAGLWWRGLVHDLSKFSPTEFFESIRYYTGTHSPIDECKAKHGYSNAWLHHKGRNKHHYEYWQDNFDKGGEPLRMPYQYALELVCDYLGAGQAYSKSKTNSHFYVDEYKWWESKCKKPLALHPHTKDFISTMLFTMCIEGNNDCLRPARSRFIYNTCYKNYRENLKKKIS